MQHHEYANIPDSDLARRPGELIRAGTAAAFGANSVRNSSIWKSETCHCNWWQII